MRKFAILLILAMPFIPLSLSGQELIISSPQPVIRCYTVQALEEARRKNPKAETDAQFEARMQALIQQRSIAGRISANYTLPVIFHIVHNGEAAGSGFNISASLIQSQLHQLNKDFANLSNSPYAVAANTGIQFRMAQTDPLGNTLVEAGIERIDRNAKGWSSPGTAGWLTTYITNTIKPGSYWDPYKYINIWIVPISGNILGYSTFPSLSTLSGLPADAETDDVAGVVVTSTSPGSVTNPSGSCSSNPYNLGRTLTHELGHFFGLRHIWGDATCGNDYCDDTPVHYLNNSGVPSHPKPNSCGTPDEMFENYMDYSNDVILNTYTNDQVTRMQTVMLNSPRRKELATSVVSIVTLTSNKISFPSCSNTLPVLEKGTNGSLPAYRDVAVIINIEDRATDAASLTISAGGTAVVNSDYQILTTGIIYAAGDANKTIMVRILDDAIPEPAKTIVLSYTISGSGVTAGTTSQTFTIILMDDDKIYPGENTITVLSEDFGTSGGATPVGWATLTDGGPNFFRISVNGSANGSGQCAHVTNDNSLRPNTYTKTTSGVAVIRTPLIDAVGLSNISLQYKYRVAGEVSGMPLDYASTRFSTEIAPNSFSNVSGSNELASNTPVSGTETISIPSSFNDTRFYLGVLWTNNSNSTGNDPGINVDDVIITCTGTRIETALNADNTFAVPAGTLNNFKSTQNSKIIATVNNASAGIAQLNVSIAEAGNDRPTISTATGTYLRTRKVIKLTPSVADNTTVYEATFYFTPTEMAAWGASAANLKILKVSDNTNLSGMISSADGMIVSPTSVINKLSTDGYIAYTATFTGFSKFALVEAAAVLPVHWLDFTGALNNDKVKLNWTTGDEYNNKGFEVQRSIDGVNFSAIGWVNGLNKQINNYSFEDITIVKGNKYLYRLKQIDIDNRQSFSKVLSILYNGVEASFTFYPNPVNDKLVIQNNGNSQNAIITVTDITGKVFFRNQRIINTRFEISTSAWSAGTYIIRIDLKDEPIIFKMIKK